MFIFLAFYFRPRFYLHHTMWYKKLFINFYIFDPICIYLYILDAVILNFDYLNNQHTELTHRKFIYFLQLIFLIRVIRSSMRIPPLSFSAIHKPSKCFSEASQSEQCKMAIWLRKKHPSAYVYHDDEFASNYRNTILYESLESRRTFDRSENRFEFGIIGTRAATWVVTSESRCDSRETGTHSCGWFCAKMYVGGVSFSSGSAIVPHRSLGTQ